MWSQQQQKRVLEILVLFEMIVFLLIFFSSNVSCGFGDYQHEVTIVIKNIETSSFVSEETLIKINTNELILAGELRDDCEDLLFADETYSHIYNHSIFTQCNTNNTLVFIRFPTFDASEEKIVKMLYNNPLETDNPNHLKFSGSYISLNKDACSSEWGSTSIPSGYHLYLSDDEEQAAQSALFSGLHSHAVAGELGTPTTSPMNLGDNYDDDVDVPSSSHKHTFSCPSSINTISVKTITTVLCETSSIYDIFSRENVIQLFSSYDAPVGYTSLVDSFDHFPETSSAYGTKSAASNHGHTVTGCQTNSIQGLYGRCDEDYVEEVSKDTHQHSVSITVGSDQPTPRYVTMVPSVGTDGTLLEENFSESFIFLATKIPPMGFELFDVNYSEGDFYLRFSTSEGTGKEYGGARTHTHGYTITSISSSSTTDYILDYTSSVILTHSHYNTYPTGTTEPGDSTLPGLYVLALKRKEVHSVSVTIGDAYNCYDKPAYQVCSNRGHCVADNDCECYDNTKHFGDECENSFCFEIESTDNDVCNERGTCKEYNFCECFNEEVSGDECDEWNCFGISRYNDTVCSGVAQCIDPDTCECNDDENYGDECEYPFCFSIRQNETGVVCGGNGFCNSTDNCVCDNEKYYGEECSDFDCFNINKDDSDVCFKLGNCTDVDTCECLEGIFGDECEVFYCFSLHRNKPESCGEHGDCVGVDKCDCKNGWAGTLCDVDESKVWINYLWYASIPGGAVVVICICIIVSGILLLYLREKKRNKKYKDLGGDILLEEMKTEGEEAKVASININQSLFQINPKDLELVEEIGKGGSDTTIFKANWKGRTVAYKVFRNANFTQQSDFSEFEQEVSIMSSISHPNIVTFFGATIGIVLEYCSEGDLANYMRKRASNKKPLDIKEKTLGVEYLHDRSVIHRDLKPENILISKQHPKIIDFGISKLVVNNEEKTKMVGTAEYMCMYFYMFFNRFSAPEMIVCKGDYDEKVDVYSFSMIMFNVLFDTLKIYNFPSFQMKVVHEGLRPKIVQEKIKRLFVPMWIIELMKKCWNQESANRPSFREICQTIKVNIK